VLLEDTPVAGREGDGGAELPATRDADVPAAGREGGGGTELLAPKDALVRS